MAITAPVAGAYTSTWNAVPLLYTRQGFSINLTLKGERVEETDLYGLSLIDMVYRGAQMFIDTICKVYAAGAIAPLIAWVAGFGQVFSAAAPIGRLASAAAKPLILTAVAGTPAANSPATFTAGAAIISQDNNFQLVFNSTHREVPLRWDVLTIEGGGTGTLFSTT